MSLDITVAIELPKEGADVARRFAQTASRAAELAFILDDTRVPHITLWQGRITPSRLPRKFCNVFDAFTSNDFRYMIEMSVALVVRENGNIFWNVENYELLRAVHDIACDSFQLFTQELLMPTHKHALETTSSSEELRKTILKYGFPCVGSFFEPHVTIGRVCDIGGAKSAIAEITSNQYRFEPQHLIVGRLGVFGDVVEVLERVEL